MSWLSYYPNYKYLNKGDSVLVENLHDMVIGTEATPTGSVVRFKVKKVTDHYAIAEKDGRRIICDGKLCGKNDIRVIEPNLSIPTGAKFRFYIDKHRSWWEKILDLVT